MRTKVLPILVCIATMTSVHATAQTAIMMQYGTVSSVQLVKKDSKHAGGALAGGMMGALIAGPRHRGLKIVGSAAAGAAVQGAVTGGQVQMYTVAMVNGGVVQITSEQQDMRPGDCVVVEQGQHANIRRVGSINCESLNRPKTPPEHHTAAAESCEAAKQELVKAESDDEVDRAVKKVRTLCED
jgi:hypothetical protein